MGYDSAVAADEEYGFRVEVELFGDLSNALQSEIQACGADKFSGAANTWISDAHHSDIRATLIEIGFCDIELFSAFGAVVPFVFPCVVVVVDFGPLREVFSVDPRHRVWISVV